MLKVHDSLQSAVWRLASYSNVENTCM